MKLLKVSTHTAHTKLILLFVNLEIEGMSLFFQVFIFVTLHYICGEQFVEGIAKLGCYLWLLYGVTLIIRGRMRKVVVNNLMTVLFED
jgi:hypothetical protein